MFGKPQIMPTNTAVQLGFSGHRIVVNNMQAFVEKMKNCAGLRCNHAGTPHEISFEDLFANFSHLIVEIPENFVLQTILIAIHATCNVPPYTNHVRFEENNSEIYMTYSSGKQLFLKIDQ